MKSFIDQATFLRDSGDIYECGKFVTTRIMSDRQPQWGIRILDLITQEIELPTEVSFVKHVASNPTRWSLGHLAFDRVRGASLKIDVKHVKSKRDKLELWLMGVAEQLAKICYNLTSPIDEFDDDSAVWLVVAAIGFSNELNQPIPSEKIWNAVLAV